MKTKYCWLNADYEFSGSWGEDTHHLVDEEVLKHAKEKGARLIKYECLNDEDFEFNPNMKMK